MRQPVTELYEATRGHGQPLDDAIRGALAAAGAGEHAVLSSYSAARWLAPYASMSARFFYADPQGEGILREKLRLEPVARGENILIENPPDEGILFNRIEAAPGMWATNLIQTYLDLRVSGERGAEAAEHLRSNKIASTWS